MKDLETLTETLLTVMADVDGDAWPEAAVCAMKEAGCFRAAVPVSCGGLGLVSAARVDIYERVASGSVAASLILTQHDGACELLADCPNTELAGALLGQVARGELLATIGISQLTTSRRGSAPAMQAEVAGDGFVLNGLMPWVTSARQADVIVTGAVLPDGQQILAAVPTRTPGLRIDPPMRFMALTASGTCEVRCSNVQIARDRLLRGPAEAVLSRRSPVKSLTVSCVGIGLAGAIMDALNVRRGAAASELGGFLDSAGEAYESARSRLRGAAALLADPGAEVPSMAIRAEVNDVLVRLSTTLLTVSKGSGYRAGQAAERLLREAMFFLVWSAPVAVQAGTLERIWGRRESGGLA